jgi:hypothetical protein
MESFFLPPFLPRVFLFFSISFFLLLVFLSFFYFFILAYLFFYISVCLSISIIYVLYTYLCKPILLFTSLFISPSINQFVILPNLSISLVCLPIYLIYLIRPLCTCIYNLYIVACYASEDAVQIVDWFYYNLTGRDYNYVLHWYTTYNHYTPIFSPFSRIQSHWITHFKWSLQFTLHIFTGRPLVFSCLRLTWASLHSLRKTESESESYVTTDGKSASLSWYKAPIRGLRPDFYFRTEYIIRLTVTFLIPWGALSDERTDLSFVCVAGPCQRSLSRVLFPWDSRPYFTVSDLRLPFSSPPTTRRVAVEVFDPASTRVTLS